MARRLCLQLLSVFLTLVLVAPACRPVPAVPTSTVAPTPVSPTPTATVKPTPTPRPSATPDAAATKVRKDLLDRIGDFVQEGYLTSNRGKFFALDDYSMEWAKIDYLSDYTPTGYDNRVKDFAFIGDLAWENAVDFPETSGCGLYFRLQDNGDFYSVYLDTERVVVGGHVASFGPYVTRFGVTSGTGRLSYGNPARANLAFVMQGYKAYAVIDQEFVGSYTLYSGKLLEPGYMGYFVKSGTNKGFGTRCKIENAMLWVPAE
jgi:hypothetical protein